MELEIGLEEIDDGVWNVYFGPVWLGRFQEAVGRIIDALTDPPGGTAATTAGISVMNADGSGIQQIRATSGDNMGASWSPDGTQIAYGDGNGSEGDIWLMNADGSNAHRLTSGSSNDATPVWSPDGQYIAFMSDRAGGRFQIFVMQSDGTDVQQVTYVTVGRAAYPAWR